MLDEKEMNKLFGSVVGALASREHDDEFISARELYIAALATGLDMTNGDAERRTPTLNAIRKSYGNLTDRERYPVLVKLTAALMATGRIRAAKFSKVLNDFGYSWDGADIVPLGVLDATERQLLPIAPMTELAKAIDRLAHGDESGAISSACGAVDLSTGTVYTKYGLGDPGKVSFAAKVNTALKHLGVFDAMKKEFTSIGLDQKDSEKASEHFEKSINHAAEALQLLRKRMGDVHGTRPALKSTAYDCIKFASAICGLFEGHV